MPQIVSQERRKCLWIKGFKAIVRGLLIPCSIILTKLLQGWGSAFETYGGSCQRVRSPIYSLRTGGNCTLQDVTLESGLRGPGRKGRCRFRGIPHPGTGFGFSFLIEKFLTTHAHIEKNLMGGENHGLYMLYEENSQPRANMSLLGHICFSFGGIRFILNPSVQLPYDPLPRAVYASQS